LITVPRTLPVVLSLDEVARLINHFNARVLKPEALMRPRCQAPPERGYWTDRVSRDDLKATMPVVRPRRRRTALPACTEK